MPLPPSSIKGLIRTKASSQLISGDKLPDFITAISNATSQYILSAAMINSTNIALGPGSGIQTGKVTALVQQGMSSIMTFKASSYALSGRDIQKLLSAVSFGVVNAMKSIVLQGTIIGAGPGTGTGKIAGLAPPALEKLILAQSFFRLLSGDKLKSMVSAIALGICNHIMSAGVVNCTDIGVAAPPPIGPITIPAAPGIGKLV